MPISLKRASTFVEGLDHPECIAFHPDGSLWAGGEAGQIYRISPDGKTIDTVAGTGGFILGLAFAPGAEWLVACDLRKQCLWRLDVKTAQLTEFARGVPGHPLSIPNHLAFAADGALYVTDSGHFRQADGAILRFDADGSGRGGVWHPGPFNFANGIALHPRDAALYVACTWLPGVERIAIQPDGSPGKRTVFARLPKSLPDGLAFDARGNLFVSCYTPARIYRITPDRNVTVFIEDWEAHTLCNPTNIAFGGADRRNLFAANLGRWHITRIDARTLGAPLASMATNE
ncbi:MAG: SMP-30/gluconolactonase/LRE family protein [Planctomycetes bacterium]|nr:SMP-30/gluconolactonase/LRE family protein [Planctomycetota bacterium]